MSDSAPTNYVKFIGLGSLIRLLNPDCNYIKKTEFLEASIIVKNKEIIVFNKSYFSEQEQMQIMRFSIEGIELIHYSIVDDYSKIDCIKWLNVQAEHPHTMFYAFEFKSNLFYVAFSKFVAEYVVINEEDAQLQYYRLKDLDYARAKFTLTTQSIVSNIAKTQKPPDFPDQEERHLLTELKFKMLALSDLQKIYPIENILYFSPANLYLLGIGLPSPLLTDSGIAFLIVKHPGFVISLELVRDLQVVMRIIIDAQFFIKIETYNKSVTWIEPINEYQARVWKAELAGDLSTIDALVKIAKHEPERKYIIGEAKENSLICVSGEDDSELLEIIENIMIDIQFDHEKEKEVIIDDLEKYKFL